MEAIAGIFLLATIVEGTVAYLFGKNEGGAERVWIPYLTLVLGVAAAVAYKLDVLALVGLPAVYPAVGWVVSGIIIGRGSNYVNDILGSIRR